MAVPEKALGLFRRFGAPVKFAAKCLLGAALPGSPAVVEMVTAALDCVHETAKDRHEFDRTRLPPATAEDMKRAGEMLDVLGNEMQTLLGQLTTLERVPQLAEQI